MNTQKTLLFSLVIASSTAFARDGDLIDSFGDDGLALLGIIDAYGSKSSDPVVGANGSLTYCGTRGTSGIGDFVIARVRANGTPDPTFSGDGKITVDFGGNDDECNSVAVQADGRVLAAGSSSSETLSTFAIVRVNANGILDSTFGVNGRQQIPFDIYGAQASGANAITVLPDGKILVAGSASGGGIEDFVIARLLPDGSYDTTFNLTGRQHVPFIFNSVQRSTAYAMAVDSNGRIVLAGTALSQSNPSNEEFAVARMLADGSPDTTFDGDGQTTVAFDIGGDGASNEDSLRAMALQPDGKIVLAGSIDVSGTPTQNRDFGVARLLPNGAIDAAFGTDGLVLVPIDRMAAGNDEAYALKLDNGNIIVAGYGFSDDNEGAEMAIVRLRANGSRDPAFGNLGRKSYEFGFTSPGVQGAFGLATKGGKLFITGGVWPAANQIDLFVAAIENDTLFDYGCE